MGNAGIKSIKSLALAGTLLLSACGGGGNETTAVTADTDVIVQNAALHASSNIGVNVDGMVAMTNGSTVTSTLRKLVKSNHASSASNEQRHATYNDQAHDYLLPTLDGGNASRSRRGNTITIDPDENYVCQQWIVDQQQDLAISECAAILIDLTVTITATSDDTGTLSYLYGGNALLVIEYAPNSGSYELIFPTAHALIQRAALVTGENIHLPDTLAGAIKISASLDNTHQDQEAGRLSVSITQPIVIAGTLDDEKVDFSLGRSTLFSVNSNAATGNGNFTIGINSLNIAVQNLMGADESAIATIEMADFTLNADLDRSGTEVTLSNVGMGRGPFRIAIEDNDVLTVALEKFSARYNDLTREASFLSTFDLDIAVEYSQAAFGWLGDDSSFRLSALIPAGTVMVEQLNGSTKVQQGGPASFQSSYIDGSGNDENFEQDIVFTTDQCFDESPHDQRLELVSCD